MLDESWLETVRIARDCGNVSSLFPLGVTRLVDLPHTLHTAIRTALYFLKFEELPKDERPPKHYWLDADKMTAWWRGVEKRREDKIKGDGAIHDMPSNDDVLKQVFGRATE